MKLKSIPTGAVVRVGSDLISERYVNRKREAVNKGGMKLIELKVKEEEVEKRLLGMI